MVEKFTEYISPVDEIRNILNAYPCSISSLFREILQNSDDAKATKQIFILDSVTHPAERIVHPGRAYGQGPSLLAYNDALFQEEDWKAIRSISRSSKRTDTSKIGKYGLGFRTCYHLTDNPEILSGTRLALLDPQGEGSSIDFTKEGAEYTDQLAPFKPFLSSQSKSFDGTIIRLPIRISPSEISSKIISTNDIQAKMAEFISTEMDMVLLFLSHVSEIEIHQRNSDGQMSLIARASIQREDETPLNRSDALATTFRCDIKAENLNDCITQSWRLLKTSFSQEESNTRLNAWLHVDGDAARTLTEQKLVPDIAIAMPLSSSINGRLFTYLPLPIYPQAPCHIHGLFALTSSRQNLRNANETGIMSNSDDDVLIRWNKVLFEEFIPRAWAMLIPVLVNDGIANIWESWPRSSSGEDAYWKNLPTRFLHAIIKDDPPVWPVVQTNSNQSGPFERLGSLLIALSDVNPVLVQALSAAGVALTQVPSHIEVILRSEINDQAQTFLTPQLAKIALKSRKKELRLLSQELRNEIVSYLLSLGDLSQITKLPILPSPVAGNLVSLLARKSDSKNSDHVLLNEDTSNLFGSLDGSAIALHLLSSKASELLVDQGPAAYNLTLLRSENIVKYVTSRLGPHIHDATSVHAASTDDLDWVSRVLDWISVHSDGSRIFAALSSHCVIPTSQSTIVTSAYPVFIGANDIQPALADIFDQLELCSLYSGLSKQALHFLKEQGVILSLSKFEDLLNYVDPEVVRRNLDQNQIEVLMDHILICLPHPRHISSKWTLDLQARFRALPIHPILIPSPSSSRAHPYAEPKHDQISPHVRIIGVSNIQLLPDVADVMFVNISDDNLTLLQFLTSSGSAKAMSEIQVLEFSVEHLPSQSLALQRAILRSIVSNKDRIPPDVISKLGCISFVSVGNGLATRMPTELIDPKCPLAKLFKSGDVRMPDERHKDRIPILNCLRSFGLLIKDLDQELLSERLNYIAGLKSKVAENHALSMLQYLNSKQCHNLKVLKLDLDLRWLPTGEGLRASRECCHKSAAHEDLYSLVLPALRLPRLSAALKEALCWDKPLPLAVVKKQLEALLVKGGCKVLSLVRVLEELGKRFAELTEDDIDHLLEITRRREFIPTSSDTVSTASHSILTFQQHLPPGFHQVTPSLAQSGRGLLLRLGCRDRPSNEALQHELSLINNTASPSNTAHVAHAIALLAGFDTLTADEHQLDNLLVPDVSAHLRPRHQILWNDIGEADAFINLPEGHFLAHRLIDDNLARSLRLPALGHSKFKDLLQDEDGEMHEDLIVRVRGLLQDYTKEQAFVELIANALDAGAKEVTFTIDERSQFEDSSKLLTSIFGQLHPTPSLVIFNDAVFQPEDFRGIRNIGKGGKEGKTDTIGQFGLGALSMFHFTPVAVILSAGHILFLDPSKMYLPHRRSSFLASLADMRSFYPGHLRPFEGIHGYSIDMNYFDGTLIRLANYPTNPSLQITHCPEILTFHALQNMVTEDIWRLARPSVMFTTLHNLKAQIIEANPKINLMSLWNISSTRSKLTSQGTYSLEHIKVTGRTRGSRSASLREEWYVVTDQHPKEQLPPEFSPLVQRYRLRSPIVSSIAANVSSDKAEQHMLFSKLPLPIFTDMPVHISSSFILAPDRRNVRYDGDGMHNNESQYNRWLMSDVIPPLYLFLLHHILDAYESNFTYWPSSSGSSGVITSALVDSFYSKHLPHTNWKVLRGVNGDYLSPTEAIIISGSIPPVKRLVKALERSEAVESPNHLQDLLKTLPAVTPLYIKSILPKTPTEATALFLDQDDKLDFRSIAAIIRFLLDTGETAEVLSDITLLPLCNHSLATIYLMDTQPTYYTYRSELSFLPSDRLVHPRFHEILSLHEENINVSELDTSALRELLGLTFTSQSQWTYTRDIEPQITSFWNIFPTLQSSMNVQSFDVQDFALVPTAHPNLYISLKHCRASEVLLIDGQRPGFDTALLALGAVVIIESLLPRTLRDILRQISDVNRPLLEQLLQYFGPLGRSVVSARFSSLSPASQRCFAETSRTLVASTVPRLWPQGLPMSFARDLPVWNGYRTSRHVGYHSAFEVHMLPSAVSRRVIENFLDENFLYTDFSVPLHMSLKEKPVSLDVLCKNLNLPQSLAPGQMESYKPLLEALLSESLDSEDEDQFISLPNQDREMVRAHALYSRQEPLFLTVLEHHPRHLLHEELRHLEDQLVDFGMQNSINFSTFKQCASLVDSEVRDSTDRMDMHLLARARATFECYVNALPLAIRHNTAKWQDLGTLQFVPRLDIRRQSETERTVDLTDTQHMRNFGPIVAPQDIVRLEFEAVAWTQKALCDLPDDAGLLVAYPGFGKPSVSTVINHLRTLASVVAYTCPSRADILIDLRETYTWLSTPDREEDVTTLIAQCSQEKLFLNVDDPDGDEWSWRSADELFFNIVDSNSRYGVREFLLPFRTLLLATGAKEVKLPQVPAAPAASSGQSDLSRIRFNTMRQEGKLTDVILFVEEDGKRHELPAHRIVLAAASDYFYRAFCGDLKESGPASAEDPVQFSEQCSAQCLESVLNYIYTGDLPNDKDPNDLLAILMLAHYWELTELKQGIERKLVLFIDLDTYQDCECDCPIC